MPSRNAVSIRRKSFTNCKPKPVIKQQWAVRDMSVYDLTIEKTMFGVDYEPFNELIVELMGLDRELGLRMENTVHILVNDVANGHFVAGWQACQHPERIIFNMGCDDE